MDFYNHLPSYNVTSTTERSFFVQANVPLQYKGLIAVYVVLVVHLCVCGVIMYLFTTQSRWSEIGNEWQSVAQIANSEEILADVLQMVASSSSREIHDKFRGLKSLQRTVVVGRNDKDDCIGLCHVLERHSR